MEGKRYVEVRTYWYLTCVFVQELRGEISCRELDTVRCSTFFFDGGHLHLIYLTPKFGCRYVRVAAVPVGAIVFALREVIIVLPAFCNAEW